MNNSEKININTLLDIYGINLIKSAENSRINAYEQQNSIVSMLKPADEVLIHASHNDYKAGFVRKRHTHNHYEIILITRGEGTEIIDGKPEESHQGDVFFISNHKTHEVICGNSGQSRALIAFMPAAVDRGINEGFHYKILADFILFEPFFKKSENSIFKINLSGCDFLRIACLWFTLIRSCRRTSASQPYFIRNHFLSLCSALIEEYSAYYRLDNKKSGIFRAMNFIKENLRKNISLNDVARAAGQNPQYLSRAFKKHTGLLPKQYIYKTRIQLSKELLCVKNITITRAAMESGYNDLAYFYRQFEKECRMTPSQYRRERCGFV